MNKSVAASVNNSVMNNNFKKFNLDEAKKGAKLVTRDGKKVKFICISHDKILATVFGKVSYEDRQYKFNLDASRYKNLIHNWDLMIATESNQLGEIFHHFLKFFSHFLIYIRIKI